MLLEQNSCLEEESAPGPAPESFQKHRESGKERKKEANIPQMSIRCCWSHIPTAHYNTALSLTLGTALGTVHVLTHLTLLIIF